ncbi:MAG: hypothetical protein PHS14_20005 [Elusimicrobia bacterium]|nr:hypothetical protein [Elusimicrobiota bacterium]
MSRVSDLKDSIVTALKAMPALADVDVRLSRSERAPFLMFSRKRGVFVVYKHWQAQENSKQFAGQPRKRNGFDTWSIVVMSESYRSAEDAFGRSGGADELLDAVLDLRGFDIAPSGFRGTLHLEPTDADLTEGEEVATAEGGGTVGYIVRFTSEPYSL